MNTESVAVLAGVLLIAIGCGVIKSLSLGDTAAIKLGSKGIRPAIVVGLLGVLLVGPYIWTAWSRARQGTLFPVTAPPFTVQKLAFKTSTPVKAGATSFTIVAPCEVRSERFAALLTGVPEDLQDARFEVSSLPKERAVQLRVWPNDPASGKWRTVAEKAATVEGWETNVLVFQAAGPSQQPAD